MNTKNPPKKIWLVNRDFQIRYTAAGVAAGLVSTLMTLILILYPLFKFRILTMGLFLPTPVFLGMIAAAVLNCIIQVAIGIMLTHRIAGPMFSMIRQMRRISLGHWKTSMRLRPNDDLKMLARHMNEMSEGLVNIAKSDLESIAKIKQSVQEFKGEPGERDFLLTAIDRLLLDIEKRIESPKG